MRTEGAGRKGKAPRGVHLGNPSTGSRTSGEAMEIPGADIEHVNQAASTARNIILLCGILLCEGNEDDAVQILHVERSVSRRSCSVGVLREQHRIAIIDIERA